MLWNNSPYILVESEDLVYPLASLVAEFGGTLGLFLGFSFMAVWDESVRLGWVFMKLNNRFAFHL